VLGPKRLPQIANQLGSWIGQARRMTRAMRRQLEDEINFDDEFDIKPPKSSPPFSADGSVSGDEDDAPEAHVPSDDDSYSPLHDEGDENDEESEAADEEAASDAKNT